LLRAKMLNLRLRRSLYIAELVLAAPSALLVGLMSLLGFFFGFYVTVYNLVALLARSPGLSQDTITLVLGFGLLTAASAAGLCALSILLLLSWKYLKEPTEALRASWPVLLALTALSLLSWGFLLWARSQVTSNQLYGDLLLVAVPLLAPHLHLALETWAAPRDPGIDSHQSLPGAQS
jgi:hypothetical protein